MAKGMLSQAELWIGRDPDTGVGSHSPDPA